MTLCIKDSKLYTWGCSWYLSNRLAFAVASLSDSQTTNVSESMGHPWLHWLALVWKKQSWARKHHWVSSRGGSPANCVVLLLNDNEGTSLAGKGSLYGTAFSWHPLILNFPYWSEVFQVNPEGSGFYVHKEMCTVTCTVTLWLSSTKKLNKLRQMSNHICQMSDQSPQTKRWESQPPLLLYMGSGARAPPGDDLAAQCRPHGGGCFWH